MKETQAAIIETSKYPVRFFHHDFSYILKIIFSIDFVEKKFILTFAQLLLEVSVFFAFRIGMKYFKTLGYWNTFSLFLSKEFIFNGLHE